MSYVLRCFPHDDHDFAATATAQLAELNARVEYHATDGVPEELAAALRWLFPALTVHRAESLATLVPGEAILYVYRDGRP